MSGVGIINCLKSIFVELSYEYGPKLLQAMRREPMTSLLIPKIMAQVLSSIEDLGLLLERTTTL